MRGRLGRCLCSFALVSLCALTGIALEGQESLAIVGGRVHTLAGPPQESATVLVRDGRIEAVGRGLEVPEGAGRIDAAGLEVVPGFFDALTTLGLSEIERVPATQDTTEIGAFHPQLRALTAIHPASEHIPIARANGVTHAGVAPRSGAGYGIPGQMSAIHLSGWTAEDMVIAAAVGMVVRWPLLTTSETGGYAEAQEKYDEQVEEIRAWVAAARRYTALRGAENGAEAERDLALEGLAEVVAGRLPLIVRADRARQIRDVVSLAQAESLRLVLIGGREAWKVKELLAERSVPVILGPVQTLPVHEDDPYDRVYAQPAELHAAGVTIAISTFNAERSPTLRWEAGQAVAFGLPWEEALRAISRAPAEILGVDDRLGTIEPGKVANLVVTRGDPLEIRTRVVAVVVQGRPTSLETKHTRLYREYRGRPRP